MCVGYFIYLFIYYYAIRQPDIVIQHYCDEHIDQRFRNRLESSTAVFFYLIKLRLRLADVDADSQSDQVVAAVDRKRSILIAIRHCPSDGQPLLRRRDASKHNSGSGLTI